MRTGAAWRSHHLGRQYWGYIGIMEKNLETTMLYRDYLNAILALCRDNGKENGNYYNGLHRVYCSTFWYIMVYYVHVFLKLRGRLRLEGFAASHHRECP